MSEEDSRQAMTQAEVAADETSQASPVPLLPAPGDGSLPSLRVGAEGLKLDSLGPIVINSDGTTSRIANWDRLSPQEQEVALRRIAKRNRERLEELQRREQEGQKQAT